MSLILHAIHGSPQWVRPMLIKSLPARPVTQVLRVRKKCNRSKRLDHCTYWYLLCLSIGFVDSCASCRLLADAAAPETAASEHGRGFARRRVHIEVAPETPGTVPRARQTRTESEPDLPRAISRTLSPCHTKKHPGRSSLSVSGTAAPMPPRGRYRTLSSCLPRGTLSKLPDCGGTLCV
jgi:hypothetical protein